MSTTRTGSSDHSSDMFDSDNDGDKGEHNDDDAAKNENDQSNEEQEQEDNWKDADFLCFSGATVTDGVVATAAASAHRSTSNDSQQEQEEPEEASSDDEDDDDDDDGDESESGDATALSQDAPWMNGGGRRPMPYSINHLQRIHPLVRLHNEMTWFVRLIEPTAEETRAREQLVQRIRAFVTKTFGNNGSKVRVFGSQATGLFLPTSDIDIVVYTKNNNSSKKKKKNEKDVVEKEESDGINPLHQFADALREEWSDELSYLETIENTKVPLVKFTHEPTNVCVDVCFDQETGPPAAQLMKEYLDALPPLRPLTFCLKYFLAARGLNEPYSGGVGSFLLQLMIVSFLQQRERYAVHFQRPTLNNLGCMLLEFLQLFGTEFNYATTAISVRKDGFYFSKGHPDTRDVFFNPTRPLLLALENPLDPQHDVGTSSFRMPIVQRSFGIAYRVLLALLTDSSQQQQQTNRGLGVPNTAETLTAIFSQQSSGGGNGSGRDATPVVVGNSLLAYILPPNQDMRNRAIYKQQQQQAASIPSSSPPPSKKRNSTRTTPPRNNKRNNNNNSGRKRQRR